MEGTFNLVWTGETTSVMPMLQDRKSGSAGMPRPISYAVFCLEKRVAPGWVDTEMTAGGVEEMARLEAVRKTIPLGRMATPEEFFLNNAAPTDIYTLSLPDALPI